MTNKRNQKLQDFQAFLYGVDGYEKDGIYSEFVKSVGNYADKELIKEWEIEVKRIDAENEQKEILNNFFIFVPKEEVGDKQAFLIEGKWYVPRYGCDTIEMLLDELL